MPHIGYAAGTKGIKLDLFPEIITLCNHLTGRLQTEIQHHLDELYKGRELEPKPFPLTFDEKS